MASFKIKSDLKITILLLLLLNTIRELINLFNRKLFIAKCFSVNECKKLLRVLTVLLQRHIMPPTLPLFQFMCRALGKEKELGEKEELKGKRQINKWMMNPKQAAACPL